MRKLTMAFLTTMAALLLAATGANAKRASSCDDLFGCSSSSKSFWENDEEAPRATRRAKSRAAANDDDSKPVRASKRRAAAASNDYDDEKPVRAAKRRQVAAKSDDEERPARRRRASADDDSSGGATYSGQASFYWQPQQLASGGRFNPDGYTAAHKTLPFGTRVRVTNQRNGQSVDVVINDRGPYVGGRIIDLSRAAAHAINMQGAGVAPVTVRVLGRS